MNDKNNMESLIKDLRKRNKKILQEVVWTISDQQKIIADWDIIFAIDFYHIFEFAYPNVSKIIENRNLQSPETISDLVQHREALRFLFSQCYYSAPILLPPHIEELKNHLKKNIHDYLCDVSKITEIQNTLFTPEEKSLIGEAYTYLNKKEKLPDNIYEDLVKLILSKKLSNVLFLLSGMAKQGLEIITYLIKNKKVIVDHDILSTYKETIERAIKLDETGVLPVFNSLRKKSFSQNINDTSVINIVTSLNKEFLKEDNNKKVIYYISDTQTAMHLFHLDWTGSHLSDSIKNKITNVQTALNVLEVNDSIHRTSDVFLEYMICTPRHIRREDQSFFNARTKTIEELEKRKSKLVAFDTFEIAINEVKNKCANDCTNCNILTQCEEIRKEIEKWKRLHNDRCSMKILKDKFTSLKNNPTPDLTEERMSTATTDFEQAVNTITSFLANKEDKIFAVQYDQKWKELQNAYFDTIKTLSRHILDFSSDIHSELVKRIKPTRRLPFKIEFTNEEIKKVINEIDESLNTTPINIDKIKKITNTIYDIVNNEKKEPEKDLFSAIINYNLDKHNNVNYLLSHHIHCEPNERVKNYENFLLIYLLSQHQFATKNKNLLTYNESLNLCCKAIDYYPNDHRFRYMKGIIIGRGIEANLEKEKSINDVLTCLDELSGKYDDELFSASILNGYAYAICLSEYNRDDLNKELVQKAINKFKQIAIPKENWEAHFLDTQGLLFFLEAKISQEKEDRDNLCAQAITTLQKAEKEAEKTKYFNYEIRTIRKHIKVIKTYLKTKKFQSCQ